MEMYRGSRRKVSGLLILDEWWISWSGRPVSAERVQRIKERL